MNKQYKIVFDDIERMAKLSSNSLIRQASYGLIIHSPDLSEATLFAKEIMEGINAGNWHVEEMPDEPLWEEVK